MFGSTWKKKDYDLRAKRKSATSGRYVFTLHSEYKMREYHLSKQRVIRVIRSPQRTEEGIVEDTVAVMQPASVKTTAGKPSWSQEIWVMYKIQNSRNSKLEIRNLEKESNNRLRITNFTQPRLKIISAWRYPGVSPKRDPIPEHILREIESGISMEAGEDF